MSVYPAETSVLKTSESEPGVIRNHREEVIAEVRNYVKDYRGFTAEITAAVNLCRSFGIDPSADDPLASYREQISLQQRQSCAIEAGKYMFATGELLHSILTAPQAIVNKDDEIARAVELAAPAPKETK